MAPPIYAEAAAKLERLRSEFLALYQNYQYHDTMTDRDFARATELRSEITLLKDHVRRLESFDALLARSRGR